MRNEKNISLRWINNRKGWHKSAAYSKRLERQSSPSSSRPNYKHRKGQPPTYPQVFASFESIQGVHFHQGQKTKVLMNEDACSIYQDPRNQTHKNTRLCGQLYTIVIINVNAVELFNFFGRQERVTPVQPFRRAVSRHSSDFSVFLGYLKG